ncbi:MAG: hypothetical protein SO066_16540 [Proteus mirabilis]|nr:hypothetical protein [Proteus mirabilis]
MKFNSIKFVSFLALFLLPFHSYSNKSYGTMTLTLIGVVDLAKNPDPNTPQYVRGILTGNTLISYHEPIYDEYNNNLGEWSETESLVGITGNEFYCYQGMNIFQQVPKSNSKYGLPLTDDKGNINIYVTPTLKYEVRANGSYLNSSYSGTFFSRNNNGLISNYSSMNSCFYPQDQETSAGGHKSIEVYNNDRYPVYVTEKLSPGLLSYKGAPIYVVTQGYSSEANASLRINVRANLKIVRICQISSVSNNNISVVMNRENEVIQESSLTYSCTGDGHPVFVSAVVTEGKVNDSEPTKLVLNKQNGRVTDPAPWVLGKPFVNGASPALSCKDAGSQDLLKFNNQELQLPVIAKYNQMENLGIKWAICSDDTVQPGQYRGKAVVTLYTKV